MFAFDKRERTLKSWVFLLVTYFYIKSTAKIIFHCVTETNGISFIYSSPVSHMIIWCYPLSIILHVTWWTDHFYINYSHLKKSMVRSTLLSAARIDWFTVITDQFLSSYPHSFSSNIPYTDNYYYDATCWSTAWLDTIWLALQPHTLYLTLTNINTYRALVSSAL